MKQNYAKRINRTIPIYWYIHAGIIPNQVDYKYPQERRKKTRKKIVMQEQAVVSTTI